MKKAVTKAAPVRAARKTPTKLNVAEAVAPEDLKIAMKQTRTAYASGFLTSTQQARSIIGQARSLGEALDKVSEFERMVAMELGGFIQMELATKRIKLDGRDIRTEATPEGPLIVLRKPAEAPQQPAPVAANDAAPAAPAAEPAAPAKRKYVRRAK